MNDNTITNITKAISYIIDPSLKKPLVETNGIKHVAYDKENDLVTLLITIGHKTPEIERDLRIEITKKIKIDLHFSGLKLAIDEERHYSSIVNSKTCFIGFVSGKGGVGKSFLAANIAYRLMKKNYKVGLVDADIYGSSLPYLLDIVSSKPKINENGKIIPVNFENIEVISTEFFTSPSQPVIWRGGMLQGMIQTLFLDVDWRDNTDYIIIDLPPGTGDIMLDIQKLIPQAKMIIVTTPNLDAAHVAVKAGYAVKKLKHDILGVIENMSYVLNDNNRINVFGEGGGISVAKDLETELICQIPCTKPNKFRSIYEIDEINGQIFSEVADYIVMKTK